jgi:high-affinity Fe2+/Pb2+ permease
VTGTDVVTVAILLGLVWIMWRVTRGSLSSGQDSFMSKVVKVAVLVMLVGGGLVWILDRAEENNGNSDRDSQNERPDNPQRNQGGDKGNQGNGNQGGGGNQNNRR